MLLLIDTSADTATVMISSSGLRLGIAENSVARDHSAWLHPAIQQLLQKAGKSISTIEAIAVMAGPGSYTGLRVGMAAAKGICFSLKKPLITCNNLLVMAHSMVPLRTRPDQWLCPMIDARRQEVFTAVYDEDLGTISGPAPIILDKTSFEKELAAKSILFSGSGAAKWKEICTSPGAIFIPQPDVNESFIRMATDKYDAGDWADTVYSEPEYGKDFHTHVIN